MHKYSYYILEARKKHIQYLTRKKRPLCIVAMNLADLSFLPARFEHLSVFRASTELRTTIEIFCALEALAEPVLVPIPPLAPVARAVGISDIVRIRAVCAPTIVVAVFRCTLNETVVVACFCCRSSIV